MQEVFAGFLTHTDEQLGKIFSFLEEINQFIMAIEKKYEIA